MILPLVIAAALVFVNGVFVALEFALLAANRGRLEAMAGEGSKRAEHALAAAHDLTMQLAGSQFAITTISLLLGFVGEPAVAHVVESALSPLDLSEGVSRTIGLVVGLTIVVFAHTIFGEMVPKNIALVAPERTLLTLTQPTRAFLTVARPIVRIINSMARGVARLIGVQVRDGLVEAATADEIASMVAASKDEGLIADVEHQLLTGALDLAARTVESIMVPRDQIVSVWRGATAAEAEELVVTSGHSRLVVVGSGIDDVLGFVHAKELLTLPEAARVRPIPFGRIKRLPVIHKDRAVDDALVLLQRSRVHLALVRNQSGRTEGIVSLEDVLEALVGEIVDESDRPA